MNSELTNKWIVTLVDPGDGSGDAMVPLPDDLLSSLGWKENDELSISLEEKKIVLRKIS